VSPAVTVTSVVLGTHSNDQWRLRHRRGEATGYVASPLSLREGRGHEQGPRAMGEG
jgi:hypothetical protein